MIELLVVVGILAFLATLIFPVAGSLKRRIADLICSSNLRQIGVGIQNYVGDHDGLLPGPLYTAQYPYRVSQGKSTDIAFFLQDYLFVDRDPFKKGPRDVFVCPAYRKAIKSTLQSPVYTANVAVPGSDGAILYPFGYANSSDSTTFGKTTNFPPQPVSRLVDIVDSEGKPARSSTWALKDIDQEDKRLQQMNLGAFSSFPKKRVHLDHRNALFFDFHVAPTDKGESP